MKTKKMNHKLSFSKQTISKLTGKTLKKVKGGRPAPPPESEICLSRLTICILCY